MNLFANPLSDAQKVWNNVKGIKQERPQAGKQADGDASIGFTFITSSLIGWNLIAAFLLIQNFMMAHLCSAWKV
jgi:hypothetical protein